jgi:hypothetical protein
MPLFKAFQAGAAQFTGLAPATGLFSFPLINDAGKYLPVISLISYAQPYPPAAATTGFAMLVETPGTNPTDFVPIRYWGVTNTMSEWDYPCKRVVPLDVTNGVFMDFRFITLTKTVDATLYVQWEYEPVGAWA